MRIKILIFLLLASITGYGQTDIPLGKGSPNALVHVYSDFQVDSIMRCITLKNLNGDAYMITTNTTGQFILRPVPSNGSTFDTTYIYYYIDSIAAAISAGAVDTNIYRTVANSYNKAQVDGKDALKLNIADTANHWLPIGTVIPAAVDTSSLSTRINLRVKYTDTASMLAPYLRSNIAAATYQPIGTYLSGGDTVSLSNRINLRVRYADTSAMLLPYLRKIDTTNKWIPVGTTFVGTEVDPLSLHISDTATAFSKYLRKTDTATLSARIDLRVKYTDTASMLLPYLRKVDTLNKWVHFSDTGNMLLPYLRKIDTTNKWWPKTTALLGVGDTAAMLSPYLRTNIAAATYVKFTDTGTMLSPYLRKVDTTAMLLPYQRDADTLVWDATLSDLRDTSTVLRTLISALTTPTWQQVLTAGNSATVDAITTGRVEASAVRVTNPTSYNHVTGLASVPRLDTIPNKSGTFAMTTDLPTITAGTNVTVTGTPPNYIINSSGSGGGGSTLTINSPLTGTSYDGSAPVSIGIPAADISTNGYLTSIDWITFTAKQDKLVNSAGLAAALSDETGTGLAVFGTSPTIVTPTIASFANANHNHTISAGGGQLTDAALSSQVTVPKGGTGGTSLTAYGVIIGGTTSTGAVQSVSVGTSGQVLTSNGAGAAPTFQTAGGGSITNRKWVFPSSLINMKTTGTTTIFTTDASKGVFILTAVLFYSNSNVVPFGNTSLNIGWTGITYSDLFNNISISATSPYYATGKFNSLFNPETIGGLTAVPANTALRVNITGGAGSTTFNGYFFIEGFYLSTN